jgi:hypothetical protein
MKVPNPNGRKGGVPHQTLIERIKEYILSKRLSYETEFGIETNDGKKRYADVVALDDNGNPIEYHQVGKQNKNGTPVARERRTKEEIEKATGKPVIFHPYNIILLFLIISVIAIATINF